MDIAQSISIHALREEGDAAAPTGCLCAKISIHALREEGDIKQDGSELVRDRFLSTPSARRATLVAQFFVIDLTISIHALREEGDPTCAYVRANPMSISIHALREEGDGLYLLPVPRGLRISIHALREEGDSAATSCCSAGSYFYPRPPRGGRLEAFDRVAAAVKISIHALREEGDLLQAGDDDRALGISIHALREEGDPVIKQYFGANAKFLSTPSARRATALIFGKEYPMKFLSTPSARRAT